MIAPANIKQQITIDGHQIAYLAEGDPRQPALIMVHGWLSHAGVWDQTIDAFCNRYYCVAIDLLGHAGSDKPRDGDYSIPAQARRVMALADHLGISTYRHLGHSMGGQIGLYTALHYPERLDALISVSGVVTGRLSAYIRLIHWPVFWFGAMFPAVWNFSRIAARRGWRWYTDIFDRPIFLHPRQFPTDTYDREMATLRGVEVPFYRELGAISGCDLSDRLDEVRARTLVVFGRQDGTVSVRQGEMMAARIPGAQIALIDDCGHSPMREKPVEYLSALKRFLDS
jgi:pimeloyl-ACP methyl ester carboxylesterase